MKYAGMNSIALLVALVSLFLGMDSSAAKLGAKAHSYKYFATLANGGVQEGKLARYSTLMAIDAFLITADPEVYAKVCKDALNGPQVLALENPRQTGGMVMIGFTEETNVNSEEPDSKLLPENGRYVFFWLDGLLQAVLYKSPAFDEMMKIHQIDIGNSGSFNFPELRLFVSRGGGNAIQILPPSFAPSVPETNSGNSRQIEFPVAPQRMPKRDHNTELSHGERTGGELPAVSQWIWLVGGLIFATIAASFWVKYRRG
jgi:hypothetical protein